MNSDYARSLKGLISIFLILASISFNIVGGENNASENNSSLFGKILTINDSKIIPNMEYNIVIKTGTETIKSNYTSDPNGQFVISLGKSNYSEIQYVVSQNNTEIIKGTAINTETKMPLIVETTSNPAKSSETTQPATTESVTIKPVSTEPAPSLIEGIKSFLFSWVFLIILVIFVIFPIILYLMWDNIQKLLTGNDDASEGKHKNLIQMQADFHKLKVELVDDSGMRLSNKIVTANAKNNPVPQGSSRSDINGECTLDLFKGKYNINVEVGDKYESVHKEINLKSDENIQLILNRRQSLQIELVDESGTPLNGFRVRVLEAPSYVDIINPIETDNNGIAEFYISKNKQYVTSVQLTDEYIKQDKIPINNSEAKKRIQLVKRMGTLEVTVTEQATEKTFAGIPVTVTKKGTNSTNEFLTDESGKISQKIPIGDYIIRLKPGSFPLYESSEKYIAVIENRMSKIIIDFKFNFQSKPQDVQLINTIREKLETSYKEVSAYDACIPLFFKRVGEKPTKLVENITKRPIEFLGAKTSPDEIIPHILKTAEFISGEISRIMREKSNVDFYYSIQKLDPVNDLNVSDYSNEKFRELVHDIENYHKNHKTEIGNKLHEIDAELTQLSGDLTIQPVADLWRVAQKLQENSLNESDIKKRGVMLFLNDKLLDHVREMYNKEEVKARLKFSMV